MEVRSNINRCRIDVGLSATAPYSAYWLNKYTDMLVIGIEPNPYNMDRVKDGEAWVKDSPYLSTNEKIVKLNGENICFYEERGNQFIGYEYAIDDVETVTQKEFYCTSELNTGCSSLHKPIDERLNGVVTEKVINVDTISLASILEDFPYYRIPIIDFLKTDTQSNDINVLRSCGKHLKNICFVQCEWNTNGQYEGEKDIFSIWKELSQLMHDNNFSCYYQSSTDAAFVNNELIPYIIEHGIMNDGFENQNGTNFIK